MDLEDQEPPPPSDRLDFKPARIEEAQLAADLITAWIPDEPEDPMVLRHSWGLEQPQQVQTRHIIRSHGMPIGFLYSSHAAWDLMPERYAYFEVMIARRDETSTFVHEAAAFIEERLIDDGAEVLTTDVRETDSLAVDVFAERGYRPVRTHKTWELDLAGAAGRISAMATASRQRMESLGIRLEVLSARPTADRHRRLHACFEAAAADEPTTVPHVPMPPQAFEDWLGRPSLREDRIWVAWLGDEMVGYSMLAYPPIRGTVTTNWTGTVPTIRGRGVARALKLETLVQAIGAGVGVVRTSNDGANEPILHLNRELGYREVPGWIEFHRPVR